MGKQMTLSEKWKADSDSNSVTTTNKAKNKNKIEYVGFTEEELKKIKGTK